MDVYTVVVYKEGVQPEVICSYIYEEDAKKHVEYNSNQNFSFKYSYKPNWLNLTKVYEPHETE